MKIQSLSSVDLHEKLVSISHAERKLTLDLLHHLHEFDRRKLYANRGHSSLFEYVVQELKYSESAAQRRIFAMRALRDLPELEERVESGELKVTQLAQVQSFLRMEQKQGKRFTVQEKKKLIESTLGKSTRETEKLLAEKNPEFSLREKVRVVTPTLTQVTFTADETLMQDLARVRDRFAHRLPTGASMADVVQFLAQFALKSVREEKEVRKSSLPAPVVASRQPSSQSSRYVPIAVRKAVWIRDQGKCTYVSNPSRLPGEAGISRLSGKKCESRHRLEFDHIRPLALGGATTVDNLRLLCFTHNQSEAQRLLGERVSRTRVAKNRTLDWTKFQ